MVTRAILRYLKTSPQKVRLIVDEIRGKDVNEALSILRFSKKHAAKDVRKVLSSAVANAQQGEKKVDVDHLFVSRAYVDAGPIEKRARIRAMGRIFRIMKRSCHVTIHLDEKSK